MSDFDTMKEIKVIKCSADKKICLVEDLQGKKYIKLWKRLIIRTFRRYLRLFLTKKSSFLVNISKARPWLNA